MKYVLGVPYDPLNDLNPVVLEHAEHEPADSTADQGFDSQVGDLLNATDGVSFGQCRFLHFYVPFAILPCHHDCVGTVQPVSHAIFHPYDADRFHDS